MYDNATLNFHFKIYSLQLFLQQAQLIDAQMTAVDRDSIRLETAKQVVTKVSPKSYENAATVAQSRNEFVAKTLISRQIKKCDMWHTLEKVCWLSG